MCKGTVFNSWKKWNWKPPAQMRLILKSEVTNPSLYLSLAQAEILYCQCAFTLPTRKQGWENRALPISSQLRGCAYLIVNIYKAFCRLKLKWRTISHYCRDSCSLSETSFLWFSCIRDKQLLANVISDIFFVLSFPLCSSSGKVKITSGLPALHTLVVFFLNCLFSQMI